MFPKMGRDFIHISDFIAWATTVQSILAPFGIILPPITNAGAIAKANQYKDAVESGEEADYIDLVEIDKEDKEG